MKVRFLDEAATELVHQFDYLEAQHPGLGVRFRRAVEATVARIAEHPRLYPVIDPPDVRRSIVPRFGCSIHYRHQPRGIEIVSIAAHRRQPGYWKARLPSG